MSQAMLHFIPSTSNNPHHHHHHHNSDNNIMANKMSTSFVHPYDFRKPNHYSSPAISGSVNKTEEMSGDVILIGPSGSSSTKRYVHIKVYRTSLEHFAVVYPLSKISRPLGIINLRTAEVEPIESAAATTVMTTEDSQKSRGFLIRQKVFDTTTTLTILLCPGSTSSDLDAWWNAFSNNRNSSTNILQQKSCLPILEEED